MVADSPYRKSTQTDADVDQLLSAASINVTKHCATGELPNVNMAVSKQFCCTAHKVMCPRLVPLCHTRLQSSTTHSNFDTLQCILNLSCMRLQHACSNTYTKHILLWWPWAVNAAGFSFQPYVCVVTIDITAQPCTLVKGSQQQNYSKLKFQEQI